MGYGFSGTCYSPLATDGAFSMWSVPRLCKENICIYLITYGAEPFLRRFQLCSNSGTSLHFMDPEDSLPFSREPSTGPNLEPGQRLMNFRNNLIFFCGEEFLAPRPTPKLEDHPLSAVRDCSFNIFATTLHICRPSPPSAT
jgi:hypothetical protein